jgi:peptidyl-tRNA hydrolase, PTH1 family
MAGKMKIIMGLGNPGKEYAETRHNAGRMAVLDYANKTNFPELETDKYVGGLSSSQKVGKNTVLLLFPDTYMNNSGNSLKKILNESKNLSENLIVVHDDLDLPLGTLKIVKNRGAGGHRGVESVIKTLKSQDFVRIRIGIAKPAHLHKHQKKDEVVKIVVGKFTPQEKVAFKKVLNQAVAAIETILENGPEHAMNEFNRT